MAWTIYNSPLGSLILFAGEAGLCELRFPGRGPALDEADHDPEGLVAVRRQLDEYLAGERPPPMSLVVL